MNIKAFFTTSKKSSGCALELKNTISEFMNSEKSELIILSNNAESKALIDKMQSAKADLSKALIKTISADKIQIGTFYNALQDVVKKEAYEKMKSEKKFGSNSGSLEKNEKIAVYLSK